MVFPLPRLVAASLATLFVLGLLGSLFYYVCVTEPENAKALERALAEDQALHPSIDESLHPDRVYIGEGFFQLRMDGWERDMGWPLAPYSILASGDSLVLQTEKDHPFTVERFSVEHSPPAVPTVYNADAYRYVPIDSSLIQVPRWQWRNVIDRLKRLENVNRR